MFRGTTARCAPSTAVSSSSISAAFFGKVHLWLAELEHATDNHEVAVDHAKQAQAILAKQSLKPEVAKRLENALRP